MIKSFDPPNQAYVFSYDLLRVIAIIAVVSVHVVYPVYGRWDFLGGISWWLANFINTFGRLGVPLFIMVSGALMLSSTKIISVPDLLKKIFKRIGFPLIIWSLFYLLWDIYFLNSTHSITGSLKLILSGNIFNLYFLVILLWLYLFLPLLKVGFTQNNQVHQRYLLVVSLVITLLTGVSQYFFFKTTSLVFFATYWVPYLSYFLGGYYFSNQTSFSKKICLCVFTIAFIFTLISGYIDLALKAQNNLLFWKEGGLEYWGDYLSPNVFLLAISLFILVVKGYLKPLLNPNRYYRQVVWSIARASFGIYLVHAFVINILDNRFGFSISLITGNLWWYLLQKLIFTFVISYVITTIIHHLPIVKSIIGE